MVLRTSSSEPPSEDEGSANESVPLDSPRPSPAQQLSGQQRQAQQPQPQLPQQPLRSPTRTTIEVEASSGAEDDGGTLRIKDLDTGREMQIKQKYTIRNMDTGEVYVLDGDDPPAADGMSRSGSQGVTDVMSGNKMTFDELDQALGLQKTIAHARQRRREGHRSSGDDSSSDDTPKTAAPVPSKGVKGAKGWLQKRFQKSRGGAPGTPHSDAEDSAASFSTRESAGSLYRDSLQREGPAPSASGQDIIPVSVQAHQLAERSLPGLALVQELHAHSGVMWAMKFSGDGRYLASAGQDTLVCVWQLLPSRGGPPDAAPADSNGSDAHGGRRWVASPKPVRQYRGHKADVLDVAWSKSHQFLLSASMDRCVRLWHISRDDCLRVFRHTDFVTALDFHPVDEKCFVSGTIDGKVHLWNITDQRIMDSASVHEMVTAIAFAPRGERLVVGSMKGRCRFFACTPRTCKLEYEAQIDVKNRRGNAKGRKITGMQWLPGQSSQLLITSNDSRIRLYDGFALKRKYKGASNRNTQIRSTFSPSGSHLICGSDDGWVYVWASNNKRDKSASYECFHAHDDIVTVAIFAPESAWLPHANASNTDPAAGTQGQVIFTAGYTGEIKVFESLGGAGVQ